MRNFEMLEVQVTLTLVIDVKYADRLAVKL